MSLFNIGVTGLKSQQAALNVIGQNITNAATPGYTRQRVNLETIVGSSTQLGASGVTVGNVQRIADAFIDEQVRTDSSLKGELSAYSDQIRRLESSLFDSTAGIDVALRGFFSSLQDLSSEPSDLALRDFVLNSAEALTDRFQGVAERTWLLNRDTVSSLESATQQLNELATILVDINDRIAGLDPNRGSTAKNALLDQRENVLKDLASLVSVTTEEQSDGQVNVFVGKGQPLVLGKDVAVLSVTGDGEISIKPAGAPQEEIITNSLTGGEIGGLVRYREQVLWPTQNELGRLAASLSLAFNEQHGSGIDLEGRLGGDFFRDVNDERLVRNRVDYLGESTGESSGTINVYIDDPFAADPDDYIIRFSEENAGSYTVSRRSDGEIVFRGTSLATPQSMEFEGIRVELANGTFAPGDALLIRPYAGFPEEFEVALTDPKAIALASPVLVESRPANEGSGEIRIDITDSEHPIFAGDQALLPPLLVDFISDTNYRILDNSDPANPRPLDPDLGTLSIIPGAENHLLPFQAGSSVVNTSGPAVGSITTSLGAVSDFSPLDNGYPAGQLSVDYSGSEFGDQVVSVPLAANASAAEMASELNQLSGIRASATTNVELSNLVNYGDGTPMELTINGVSLANFNDLGELADAINDNPNLASRGIIAKSDGQTLSLTATDGRDLSLHFQGDPNESVTLTNGKGESVLLNGSVIGSYSAATIGGEVSVVLDPGLQLSSNVDGVFASEPVHARADYGIDAVLSGDIRAGDQFMLAFNSGGVADNRNGLALASLSELQIVGDPPRSFSGAYGGMVQTVGIQSAQANLNLQAADSLLAQSETFRESVSGVNLDEEAANLIQHEQAYNAAAQVISIARDIFNTLLNSVT